MLIKEIIYENKVVDPHPPADLVATLSQGGYNAHHSGNKIVVTVDIPPKEKNAEYRKKILAKIAGELQKIGINAAYSAIIQGGSTIGHVAVEGSKTFIVCKDTGKQGGTRAGVKNEHDLVKMIQEQIKLHGSVDVTFQDPEGRLLPVPGVNSVDATGTNTAGGKKADVVLSNGQQNIPVSIKQINAEVWESADTLFGPRARNILDALVQSGQVKLIQDGQIKVRGQLQPNYKIDKEIVVEPTEQDAMQAVFGSDLNPHGGIVIQDFHPKHFLQNGRNITVECYAVIKTKEDIPDSHLMYFLIKNFPNRKALGYYGVGTQAVTMTRAFGKNLTKSPIFVDQEGNPVPKPVAKSPHLQIHDLSGSNVTQLQGSEFTSQPAPRQAGVPQEEPEPVMEDLKAVLKNAGLLQ
jgi:hypothetical protein